MAEDALLTPAEAAARLNVKRSWIYNRISAGTLPFPHLKVGGLTRIERSALENYIEGCRRGKGGKP